MDTENDIADAVGVTEHPGQESAAEVAGELAPPTNAQQPVQGLDGDAYADDAAHMAAAGAPAPDGLATAGAEHMATDAYQPTAEEYAAYYQQHADHYQQEGMAAPDEDADAHALTSLYTVEDGQQKQLTVADVNAMAQHPEGEWTPEDEQELLQLSNDEQYRALKMGAPWAHWSVHDNVFAGMAAFLKRTIRDVRQKVHEKLAAGEILAGKHGDAAVGGGEGAPPPEGAPGGDVGGTVPPGAADADGIVDGAVAGLPQHGVALVGHEHMSEGLPAEVVAHMGYQLDQLPALTAEQMQQMAAQVQSLTPEQVAAYQQQIGIPLQQFQLAAGQVAYAAAGGDAAAAAQGLPADAAAAAAVVAAAYPGGLDAQALLAHQLAAVHAASPFPIPLPVGPPPSSGVTTTNNPRNDRHFWKEAEQQELLRLVADQAYRQSVLGIAELSWDAIAKHLGRGKRSVQRKYDNLKGSLVHGPPGAAPLPSNDGKKWSVEEVAELLQLVEDEHYRRQRLGLEKVDWRAFGQHFGRSYESVSYKYSYIKNTGRTGQEGKAKHAKAKHETSYKEMAIFALQQLAIKTGVPEGTSGQICGEIVQNPIFQPQLDTAIVSGKKTLQRWKHGVRSALNAFPMFTKTGAVRDGEVVWRLDEASLLQEMQAQAAKANRARQKPLSGAQRRKMRRVTGESGNEGEEVGEEAGEEAAHEALTAMLAGQRPPSARLAARKRPGQADSDYDDEEERERPRKKAKSVKRDSAAAVNGHARPPLPTPVPGLAAGAGGQMMMAPEAMFAVLPLMMQPGAAGGDASALAAFAAAGQPTTPDFMSALTPQQREALEKQQRAAEAAGLLRPAGGAAASDAAEAAPAADPAPAPAATLAAAEAAAPEAAVPGPGQLQPWLAQMAWPPAAGGGEMAHAQAAVAAAFMAATAPAAAAAEAAAEGVPATADGAPAAAPAMDAAAIFAAAEAEAARLAAAQAAGGAGEGGGSAALQPSQDAPPPASVGGSGDAAAPEASVAQQAAGPELAPCQAAAGAPDAAAAGAAATAGEAAAEAAAPPPGEVVGGADLQMEQLHAYLAQTHGHVEGGGGVGGDVAAQLGASLDPASMAHYASLDADQQAAYLAQHSYPADAHGHQQYHYADGATTQLPFDAAAMFAAQGQTADMQHYDQHGGQYVGQDAGQYDAARYQHAAQHGPADHAEQYHHAPYYDQHAAAAAEHELPADAQHYPPAEGHQHYAAADGQQYGGEHGQYAADAQHYAADGQQYGPADAQQHYAAEAQQYAAEHAQYDEHGQPYSAEQQAAYAAEHGQAYAAEGYADGQAYAADHGQAYSAEHGQAYSSGHGQAYSAEHGQAYSAEHGQAYSAEHGQAYSTEHGQAYSAEHGHAYAEGSAAAYPPGHAAGYAAPDAAQQHYGGEHAEGYSAEAYAAYGDPAAVYHGHAAAAAAADNDAAAVPAAEGYPHHHQPHHDGAPPAYAASQPQPDFAGEAAAAADGAAAHAAVDDDAAAVGHAAPPEAGEAADLVAGMFAEAPHAQEVAAK